MNSKDQTLTVRKLPDLVQASRFELPQANSKCSKKFQSSSVNWVVAGQPTYPTITSVDLAMYLWNSLLGEIKGFKTMGIISISIITREMEKKKTFFGLELGFPSPEHFWRLGAPKKKHEEEAVAGLEKKHNEPQTQICRGRNAEWGRGWQKGV
jgi:hypothetical protein